MARAAMSRVVASPRSGSYLGMNRSPSALRSTAPATKDDGWTGIRPVT